MSTLQELLGSIEHERRSLSRAEARTALREILTGDTSDAEIAALLTAIASRGETADELTGFAETMRELAVPVPLTDEERAQLIDTCGTGGDDRGTFNISRLRNVAPLMCWRRWEVLSLCHRSCPWNRCVRPASCFFMRQHCIRR
jgi:anthranilate phosphoribosyltransferase